MKNPCFSKDFSFDRCVYKPDSVPTLPTKGGCKVEYPFKFHKVKIVSGLPAEKFAKRQSFGGRSIFVITFGEQN